MTAPLPSGPPTSEPSRAPAAAGGEGAEEAAARNTATAGILACVGAMVLFAVGNGFTLAALESFSVPQTMMLRLWALLAMAAVGAVLHGGLRAAIGSRRPLLQLGRGAVLVSDQLMFSLSLVALGLAEVHALYATAPLIAMALAGALLGERIGWQRWTAVAVGFLGALVIIRPGLGVFEPAAALALVGALMYALYAIGTRLASRTDSNTTSLLYTSIVGVLVVTPFGLADWRSGDTTAWAMMTAALGFSMCGNVLLIRSYALAPASLLQPFNYVLLAAGTLIGVLMFGERPDALALVGTAAIALAGLAVAWSERSAPSADQSRSAGAAREPSRSGSR